MNYLEELCQCGVCSIKTIKALLGKRKLDTDVALLKDETFLQINPVPYVRIV